MDRAPGGDSLDGRTVELFGHTYDLIRSPSLEAPRTWSFVVPDCAGCGDPCEGTYVVLDAEHGGGCWHSACLNRRLLELGPERHADPAVAVPEVP